MMLRGGDKRIWIAGGLAVAILIALIGWFAVIRPQLSDASDRRAQAADIEFQNTVLSSRNAKLKKQGDDLTALTTSLQAALDALPFDSGLPEFTRQLSNQATVNRVTVASIAVGSTAGVPGNAAVIAIPITLQSTGSAKNQLAFLQEIQVDGPRRALVTSIQMSPAGAAKSIDASATMSLQLNVFSAPLSQSEQDRLEKLLRGDVSE